MLRAGWTRLMHWLDTFRRVFVNLIFILFLAVFLVTLFAARPEVPERAALVLELEGDLVEELALPAPGALPFSLTGPKQVRVRDVVTALERAAQDERIRAVVLDVEKLGPAPPARLRTVQGAVETFRKKSGKPVYVAASGYSQAQYLLAAAADRVYLHPLGLVELRGFSVYRNYVKGALERLKVDVHLFRAGEFKSAAEPLVRDDMSAEARAANRELLDTLWEGYRGDVARLRGVEPARLQEILDAPSRFLADHGGSLARLAKAEGLVDELADREAMEAELAKRFGGEAEWPRIGHSEYLRLTGGTTPRPRGKVWVGVVTASGPIMAGEQPPGRIGGETLSDRLDDARRDPRIKAVVLRVDSPGGSALASERIRAAVARLREAGKPVVVSMGGVAASGGYWIAAEADEIWADPTTITGSIGVFGLVADIHRGLEQLGVHTDGVGTTAIAGGLRADLPLNPELAKSFQLGVDHVYESFLKLVAEGRGLPPERVREIAGGRVWSGAAAARLGLVDELGGLSGAVDAAARLAGLGEAFDPVHLRPKRSPLRQILERLMRRARAAAGLGAAPEASMPDSPLLRSLLAPLRLATRLNDPRGIYARCDVRVE